MKTLFAMNLEIEAAKISGLQQQSFDTKTKADEEIRKRIETLKENIIKGGTTGDKIRDIVIVAHETLSEEAEQPYRQLEEMLKGREGEQVLVVRVNGSGRDQHHYEALMYLGILDSEELEFYMSKQEEESIFLPRSHEPYEELLDVENRMSSIILPISKYVLKKTGFIGEIGTTSNHKWEMGKDKVKINTLELSEKLSDEYYFLKYMPRDLGISGGFHYLKMVSVKVGEENIREFFEEQAVHEVREYENAMKILNRII